MSLDTDQINSLATRVMVAIDAHIAAGRVPALVASFSALHDHVDANMYVINVLDGVFPVPEHAGDEYPDGTTLNDADQAALDAETDAANAIMAEVDRRLAVRSAAAADITDAEITDAEITDAEITDLRTDCMQVGNSPVAMLCGDALRGSMAARVKVAAIIAKARAVRADDDAGDRQVATGVAGWIAEHLGEACYEQQDGGDDELPAATEWTSEGATAVINLEDGSRLVVTVRVEH